jgi:hypothetical protein
MAPYIPRGEIQNPLQILQVLKGKKKSVFDFSFFYRKRW